MTIQPGEPRAGHHQARNTQELLDAADQVGQRQEQRYSRDPSTDEIPVANTSPMPTDPMPADSREPHEDLRDLRDTHENQDTRGDRDGRDGQETREPASQATTEQSMGEPLAEPPAEPVAEQEPVGQEAPAERHGDRNARDTDDDEHVALFDPSEADQLRGRWREVQTAFVDDPKSAVQGADQLVAQVIQSLTASFAAHKNELDGQWQNNDTSGPATEDLRLALRRYRTLFNQLLNA